MTKKKNGLLTFIFSCLPGAGEMYMGFFKQGVSIMTLFFMLIFISSWMNIGALMYITPVVWFYSFFHANNLHSLPDEEFYEIEDKFLFELDEDRMHSFISGKRGRIILAVVLIVVGVSALWNMLMSLLWTMLINLGYNVEWIDAVSSSVPQCVVAIAIIMFGVYLIKGKKAELLEKQDVEEDVKKYVEEDVEEDAKEDVNEDA